MKAAVLYAALIVLPTAGFANHGGDAANQAAMEAHHKMMQQMQDMKPTGNPDNDFATMMIPHHQGAIDMAKVELEYGHDEKLRSMAQQIIASQEKEIQELQNWLEAGR